MKTYLEHLLESDREYHFRIKTIEPLDDEKMAQLERVFIKYELRDISGPTKTIIQEHPLDFYDIQNAEVYIVDVTIGVPQSSYIIQQELRENLGIPEKYIVVRGDNEPIEVETQRRSIDRQIKDEAKKKGLTKASLLDTNEVYPESKNSMPGNSLYGDEYNSKFLQTLANIAATRTDEIKKPNNGLFDWLCSKDSDDAKMCDDNDFNASIDDAPRSVPWWKVPATDDKSDELSLKRSIQGNLDDDHEEKHVEFEDEAKKRKTLSAKSNTVRK